MKAIHLTAYGNPAQNLMMVEVSEPKLGKMSVLEGRFDEDNN